MATDIKQSARKFREFWTLAKDSEVGGYQKFWLSLLGDVLREKISQTANAILDVRGKYPDSSLADIYDPLTMPTDLVKAHAYLDTLVDKAYGLKPDTPEPEIVAHLFKLYAEKTNPQISRWMKS